MRKDFLVLRRLITRILTYPDRYICIFVLLVHFLCLYIGPCWPWVVFTTRYLYVCMYGWEGRHSMDLSLRHLGLIIFWERRSIQRPKGDSEGDGFLMFESEGVGIFGDG